MCKYIISVMVRTKHMVKFIQLRSNIRYVKNKHDFLVSTLAKFVFYFIVFIDRVGRN